MMIKWLIPKKKTLSGQFEETNNKRKQKSYCSLYFDIADYTKFNVINFVSSSLTNRK